MTMLFNSYGFLFGFLPLALAAFFWLRQLGGRLWALVGIGLGSILFYALWDVDNLRVFLPSLGVNFLVGRWLASARRHRRALVTIGVAFNLGLLGYFKYTTFVLDSVASLTDAAFGVQAIALPLGISFFTFEQIAYVVDAYRGRAKPYSFLEYVVFVAFFPHLIAGPIIQHDELVGQLDDDVGRPRWDNLAVGATLFTLGLCKKVVLADTVARYVGPVYDQGLAADAVTTWLATVAYSIQLYFDFSGYSDMAIGLARMLNVRLPANFDSPYKAHNIIEFWRRWHMTLSRFLRHYLYIPLGGGRRGPIRRHVNLMLTMLLGGLWHGAGWGFVLWGGLNGVFLVINHLFRHWRGAPAGNVVDGPWWRRELAILATFFAIMASRVLFRAPDLTRAKEIFTAHLALPTTASLIANATDVVVVVVLYGVCRIAPNSQELLARFTPVPGHVPDLPRSYVTLHPLWGAAMGVLLVIAILMMSRVSEFLYFQF